MLKITRPLRLALSLLGALPAAAWSASPATTDQLVAAAGQEDTAQPQGAEIERAPDGMFYVEVLVNGQPVRFLVDTGANVVVLTAADASRVGIPVDRYSLLQMTTAGGQAAMSWALVDRVKLAGREIRGAKVAVVQSGLPVSLLGQSMLSKLASVTIEGDRMRMR